MICVCAELNHPVLLILTGNQLSNLVVFLIGVGDERSERVVWGNDAVIRMICAHQKPAVDTLTSATCFSGKVNCRHCSNDGRSCLLSRVSQEVVGVVTESISSAELSFQSWVKAVCS